MSAPYKAVGCEGGVRAEHRVLVENSLGRKLARFELVHHVNHDKRDNRLENLEVVTPAKHAVEHLQKHPDTKVCELCSAKFSPSVNHRGRTRTCSAECRYALVSQKNRKPSGKRSMYQSNAAPSEMSRRRSFRASGKREG